MERFRNPVIVLGGGVTGLGTVRTLGRRGLDVYLAVDEGSQLLYSKYCKERYLVPGLQGSRYTLRKFLNKIGRNLGNRAVVYPTSDLYAVSLSELKDELSGDFHCIVGDEEAVKTLVNKKEFYKALIRHKVSHPSTLFPKDIEETRQIAIKIRYPVFLRPSISQTFSRKFLRKGFIARSRKELLDYYDLATKNGMEILIQDIVPGPPCLSYQIGGYVNKAHSPLALFARQRLRIYPLRFGNSTLTVSIPVSTVAYEKMTLIRFLKALGYEGIFDAEFKKDPRDGILKLLEINARCWWSIPLPSRCGVDLPFIAYLDAIGQNTGFSENYRVGIKWAYLQLLLQDCASSLRVSRSTDRLRFSDLMSSLANTEEWAWFSYDDLAPFFVNTITEAAQFLKRRTLSRSGRNQRRDEP